MLNFLKFEKTDSLIPCILTRVDVMTSNKLQVNNSVDKKTALINRTGCWTIRINISVDVRDDIIIKEKYSKIKNENNEYIEIMLGYEISANESGPGNDFLKDIIKKIELDSKLLENKNSKLTLHFHGAEYDNNYTDTEFSDLMKTLFENFGAKSSILNKLESRFLKITVDSIDSSTDNSSNISSINISGSFVFLGKFTESDFIKNVVQ